MQWIGVITITVSFFKQVVPVIFPGLDRDVVVLVGDALTATLGGWIMFLANTATTPISSPQLQVGTVVSATDPNTGVVVGHVKVPEPAPAPLAPDVGQDGVA
jgi:hypothetical protein